jgi:hypothetical protein
MTELTKPQEVKKVVAVEENGRWKFDIEGVVSIRDVNRLRQGLKVALGQHMRQSRLRRLTERNKSVMPPKVKESTDGERRDENPRD